MSVKLFLVMSSLLDIVILDAEWTAWEGSMQRDWSGEGEYREIVQISAVKIYDLETLHNSKLFSVFTKPTINPKLSEYFINLTGINQQQLELIGINFIEGAKLFSDFAGNSHCLSWGNDIKRINDNLNLISSNYNLDIQRNSDIRNLFRGLNVDITGYTSGLIDSYSDTPSIIKPGNNHNALSDCISMVSALSKLERSIGKKMMIEKIEKLENI